MRKIGEIATTQLVNSTTPAQTGSRGLTIQAGDYLNKIFENLVILCPAWKQAIDGDPKVWGEKYKAEMALALKEAGVTKGEQIKAGLAEFRRKGKPFLPGPGEFAQMCSGSQATGLTHNTAAYKFFDRMDEQKRLPKPSRSKNETAKILSGIKAKLK